MLGIGERTLYRVIQDWKLQDKIKAALAEANGNLEKAAGRHCGMTQAERRLQTQAQEMGLQSQSDMT